MRASKLHQEKVVPQMPEGISIAERPVGLEFLQRGDERWAKVIEALKVIEGTHCVQIDISGMTKSQINSMKTSIKHAGKKLGLKSKVKFAIKQTVLYIWSNNKEE